MNQSIDPPVLQFYPEEDGVPAEVLPQDGLIPLLQSLKANTDFLGIAVNLERKDYLGVWLVNCFV